MYLSQLPFYGRNVVRRHKKSVDEARNTIMSQLIAARAQMGTSLVFHIVFSVIGVGLPLFLCIAEGLALRYKNAAWMTLARQWTKAFSITFAIGAVSGAIVEFELSLLWPTWIRFSGAIIGLPFALEGFAFFLEGIFLGIYLYGWNRLTPRAHWLCSFPIWIAGLASAWFVVSANSWMNAPTGFIYQNGKVVGINPIQAILNPATPFETTHMILACYVAIAFSIAAIYAVGMLRGKRDEYHRKGLLLGMSIGLISIPLQIISGDLNARSIEVLQPTKYAAMEGMMQSGRGLPLYIGGIPNPATGQTPWAIQIPHGESLLSHFDLNSYSRGLDSFPAAVRPNPVPVHLSFDGMVGIGFFLLFIALVFWILYFLRWRKHSNQRVPQNKWLLRGVAITGPLAFIAVELGWILTEEGRQPWIIYGVLLVNNAVNPAQWMNISFYVFSVIYVLLGSTLVIMLIIIARQPKPKLDWDELVKVEDNASQGEIEQAERVGV
jgi:cytochrome d ubiquinol oxidase subunit I